MVAFVAGCDNDDKGGDPVPDVTTIEGFKKAITDTFALDEFEISNSTNDMSSVVAISNIGQDNIVLCKYVYKRWC